ncbi:hypothetical protein VTI28DRAFT_6608 [Corynascus sepedonium]
MAPVYKIAVIQLQPKDVAVEDNYSRAEAFIRQAASQGAQLAVLPEYHLTSWCPDHPDFVTACAESATYLSRYQALARELDINIVPGTICEIHDKPSNGGNEGEGNISQREIRNMAYWVEAGTGSLLASYQKANLWHSERPHLTAGVTQLPHRAFNTPFSWSSDDPNSGEGEQETGRPIRAGMLICWDLVFPEAFRALMLNNDSDNGQDVNGGGGKRRRNGAVPGIDLVVIPSYWVCDGSDLDAARTALNADSEGMFINSVLVARAFENECVVVFCNACGLSQVVAPVYGRIGRVLGKNEEGMQVVDVNFGAIGALEKQYKIRRDLGGEGWHYGYSLSEDRRER